DHAARSVFIPAVSLIHGANAFVRLRLRLHRVVFKTCRFPVSCVERVSEHMKIFEGAAARVKIPPLVDRPPVLFWQHLFNTFNRRHGRPGTGLSVKSIPAPATTLVATLRMVCR